MLVLLFSCNHIQSGNMLRHLEIENINKLKILDQDEKIIKFYSEFKAESAGNFFTDKRIAMYWIDDRHKEKSKISFAFYPDIRSIDTFYNPGPSYAPYMLITKKDSTQFRVCADGRHGEVRAFFEEAIGLWLKNRSIGNTIEGLNVPENIATPAMRARKTAVA